MAQSIRKIKEKCTLSEEKNEAWEREAEKGSQDCAWHYSVMGNVVLICLWTDEVRALLLGFFTVNNLHCFGREKYKASGKIYSI